jgi:hypothetical protein
MVWAWALGMGLWLDETLFSGCLLGVSLGSLKMGWNVFVDMFAMRQ